ncbi:MAG TPA: Uma2 family endonuclease, partial [Dehalococcoidia bacterium]|nr:Uma2 family endonuclease [Dehalococcoidia bacterium]
TYETVALEDSDEQWELVCGRLRKKPGMTTEHEDAIVELQFQLTMQLDRNLFTSRTNTRLRIANGSFFVPDLVVVPREATRRLRRERPRRLEIYDEPMPLVVEVWSPSTGDYDVDVKLAEYQQRKDIEIWRLHPYEHSLRAWRLQPDGSYATFEQRGGAVTPVALAGVRVDLDRLFAE